MVIRWPSKLPNLCESKARRDKVKSLTQQRRRPGRYAVVVFVRAEEFPVWVRPRMVVLCAASRLTGAQTSGSLLLGTATMQSPDIPSGRNRLFAYRLVSEHLVRSAYIRRNRWCRADSVPMRCTMKRRELARSMSSSPHALVSIGRVGWPDRSRLRHRG